MGLLERTGYGTVNQDDEYYGAKRRLLKDEIKRALCRSDAGPTGENHREKRERLHYELGRMVREEGLVMPRQEIDSLASELEDEIFGLGPLEGLLRDPDITEIMVNGPGSVYLEKGGHIMPALINFRDDAEIRHLIDRIIGPLNLRLDDSSPMVDARLPDGSRINAIIPPLCLNGPTLTIRKFSHHCWTPEELVGMGSLDRTTAGFLEESVRSKKNIIISGGTSSGKTSLLNALSRFIPSNERLITIEDAAELRLGQPHVLSLESRPPNLEGKGEVTMRDLVRNSLRMRPDRIIVGEVRGAEAIDMLQAMNTGHQGSLSTAHANSPEDLIPRLETMVLMSDLSLSSEAVRRQIASALDLIVHMSRTDDGKRMVTAVEEVTGLTDGRVSLEPVLGVR